MSASNPALTADQGRARWVPALQLSVQEVFSLMLGCSLEIPPEPPVEEGLDIIAMVGLAGQVCGIVTVRCNAKAATGMASRMLGIDTDQVGSHMWDAVGEICNMIAGNFKNKISGLGDGCMLSIPTVITGADYSLHAMANEEFRTAFLFEGEPVMLSLEIHN